MGMRLAVILNANLPDERTPERAAAIARMADAAGISESTVNQILSGSIECPPENRVAGLASVSGVSMRDVRMALRQDGCRRDPESE